MPDAVALLGSVDPGLPGPAAYYVLDDPLPGAAVRGRAVVLSRGLIDSDSLAAVLAHELGHADTLDGRLTEALQRLALWRDPLAPTRPEPGGEVPVVFGEDPGGGLLWGCARWALRLAGGGCAEQALSSLWAAHWRAREYAADRLRGEARPGRGPGPPPQRLRASLRRAPARPAPQGDQPPRRWRCASSGCWRARRRGGRNEPRARPGGDGRGFQASRAAIRPARRG